MKEIERIKAYEAILNEGEDLIKEFQTYLLKFEAFHKKKEDLSKYYESKTYLEDLKFSEENEELLNFPHGVLGEDYTWDFLEAYEALEKCFKKL